MILRLQAALTQGPFGSRKEAWRFAALPRETAPDRARIFVNGNRTVEQTRAESLSNWDNSFRLALGNELTSDRPWLGTYYLVAIYSRRLIDG